MSRAEWRLSYDVALVPSVPWAWIIHLDCQKEYIYIYMFSLNPHQICKNPENSPRENALFLLSYFTVVQVCYSALKQKVNFWPVSVFNRSELSFQHTRRESASSEKQTHTMLLVFSGNVVDE